MDVVGTGWDNSCPGCINRLRKTYSHLVGGSFLAGKAAWVLSMQVLNKNVINDWVRSRTLFWLKFHLGSVLESKLRQKCRYGELKTCG